MNVNRYIIKFLLTFWLMIFISCDHDKEDNIMCTMEYRMLTVTIHDEAGKPVVLDSCFIKKSGTGQIIDFSTEDPYFDSINRNNGIYLLFTDGKMSMTSANGEEFEFHGIKDDSTIVREKYKIGHDLCHVLLNSGKTEVVVRY